LKVEAIASPKNVRVPRTFLSTLEIQAGTSPCISSGFGAVQLYGVTISSPGKLGLNLVTLRLIVSTFSVK